MAYDAHLADRIRSILNGIAEFSEERCSGLTFMVKGQMCCGVLKNDLVLRLTPEHSAAALRQPHTRPMDFTATLPHAKLVWDQLIDVVVRTESPI
jgi:hypothetical protein